MLHINTNILRLPNTLRFCQRSKYQAGIDSGATVKLLFAPAHVFICAPGMPKWRNWQTHGTQNPAPLAGMRVRPPPSAPGFAHSRIEDSAGLRLAPPDQIRIFTTNDVTPNKARRPEGRSRAFTSTNALILRRKFLKAETGDCHYCFHFRSNPRQVLFPDITRS
jgi:hypothetical protein